MLFVDDDGLWRRIGLRSFEKLANEVDIVSNHDEAIKMIKEKKYDLVILDGLEGRCFQIIDEIRSKKIVQGEVVLFSGDCRVEEVKKFNIPFYDKGKIGDLISDYLR